MSFKLENGANVGFTQSQINLLVARKGDIVYNITTDKLQTYNGSSWENVTKVVDGSNGLNLEGFNIELGGTLNEDTTITTSTFYLDLNGNIRLRPTGIGATSQNKTVQLANTTGAVSLVNKGAYARRSGVLRTPHILTLPIPNGGLAMTTSYTFTGTALANVITVTSGPVNSFVLKNQILTGVGVPANSYVVTTSNANGISGSGTFTINNVIADGSYTFTIDKNTEILPTGNAGTIDFTGNANGIQTSRINASNADDSTLIEISPYFVAGIGNVVNRVAVRMTINPADDIVVCPHVSFRDYGITVTDCTNATTMGGPVIDILTGYKHARFCPANVDSIVELHYIDNGSNQTLWRNPCLYRNIIGGGAASDLISVACTVKGWEIEKYQM